MKLNTVIAPTQDSVAITDAVVDVTNYEWAVVVAYGLVGEVCNVYVNTPQGYAVIPNKAQSAEAEINDPVTALRLNGGLQYAIQKPSTSADVGIYVAFGPSLLR